MTEEKDYSSVYTVAHNVVASFDVPLGNHEIGIAWYRIPSLRVTFHVDALRGVDIRLHKATNLDEGWALSEATTGHRIYSGWGDHGPDELLGLFCEIQLPKITREKLDAGIAKARAALVSNPCPFPPAADRVMPDRVEVCQ